MKVLITCGATREPIDDVRFISNFSSGKTGLTIAQSFFDAGFETTVLAGEGVSATDPRLKVEEFTNFDDLDMKIHSHLTKTIFAAAIHLAAVSDYSVASVSVGEKTWPAPIKQKLDSNHELVLRLRRNYKIIERMKDYSDGELKLLFAFKLTSTVDSEIRTSQVSKLFAKGGVDYVVHNDLRDIRTSGVHTFKIYDPSREVARAVTKSELGKKLVEIVKGRL